MESSIYLYIIVSNIEDFYMAGEGEGRIDVLVKPSTPVASDLKIEASIFCSKYKD